jgi:hypothetical protein
MFGYPAEIRRAIYTTNSIESLNMSLRKTLTIRASFPSGEAAFKLLYFQTALFSNCSIFKLLYFQTALSGAAKCAEKMEHGDPQLGPSDERFCHLTGRAGAATYLRVLQ